MRRILRKILDKLSSTRAQEFLVWITFAFCLAFLILMFLLTRYGI